MFHPKFKMVIQKNFINGTFKLFLNGILKVERKPLQLVLRYLGTISLQTRTKLQHYIKGLSNCCKLQFIFKIQNKLCNNFRFKAPVLRIITSVMV